MRNTINRKLVSLLVLMILVASVASAEPLAATTRSSIGDMLAMEPSLFDDCEVFKDSQTANQKPALELSICETGLWQAATALCTASPIEASYHDQGLLGEGQYAYLVLIENTDKASISMLPWLGGDAENMISRRYTVGSRTIGETGPTYSMLGMSGIGISRQDWGSLF